MFLHNYKVSVNFSLHYLNVLFLNNIPIEEAKKNYFKAMGFDPKTAKPLKERLVELGLDEVLKTFYAKK